MAKKDSLARAKQLAKERIRTRLLEKQAQNEAAQPDSAPLSERDATQQELATYEAAIAASRLADSGRVDGVATQVAQPDLLSSEPDDSTNTDDASLEERTKLGARSSDNSPEANAAIDAFLSVTDGTADPMADARQRMADTIAGPDGTGQDGPRADYDGTGRSAPSQDDIGTVFRVNLDRDMATVVLNDRDFVEKQVEGGEVYTLSNGKMLWKNDEGSYSLLDPDKGTVSTKTVTETSTTTKVETASGLPAEDAEDEVPDEIIIDDEADDDGDPSGDNTSIEEKMAAAERLQRDFGIDPNTGGAVGADTGGDGHTDPVESYTTADTGREVVDKDELLRGGDDPLAPGGKYGEVDTDSLNVVTSQDGIVRFGDEVQASTSEEMPDLLDKDITADHPGSGPVLDMPGQTDESFNTVAVHELENDLGSRVDVNDDSGTKFADDQDFDSDAAVDELFDFDH